MNFYSVKFRSGIKTEIRAQKDEVAINRAEGIIKRWNQPSAVVVRTNPFNAKQSREIGTLANDQYNPELPELTSDPKELYVRPEPEKKKKPKRERKEKSGSTSSGARSSFPVPLKDVADKLELQPTALRRRLRSSDISKPEGGWGWTSWEDPAVVTILGWFQK